MSFKSIFAKIKHALFVAGERVKSEPVAVVTALVWAQGAYESGPLTWRSAVTVVVGFAIRSKVVPERDVTSALDEVEAASAAAAAKAAQVIADLRQAANAGLPEAPAPETPSAV